jgi:hypothetical protein
MIDGTITTERAWPDGAKRNPGFGGPTGKPPRIPLRSIRATTRKNEMAGENPGHDASIHITAT